MSDEQEDQDSMFLLRRRDLPRKQAVSSCVPHRCRSDTPVPRSDVTRQVRVKNI